MGNREQSISNSKVSSLKGSETANLRLQRAFFNRSAIEVARDLLGCIFVSYINGEKVAGKIVETESYWGEDDLACHASHGRTNRTEILFGEPGKLYVYLNYGIFYLTNIVCGPKDFPGAVLIRAIEVLEGKEIAHKRLRESKFVKSNEFLATGPGKLSVAFGITKEENNLDVTVSPRIWVENKTEEQEIAESKRIGVDYAKHCRDYPWRFFIIDNPFVKK